MEALTYYINKLTCNLPVFIDNCFSLCIFDIPDRTRYYKNVKICIMTLKKNLKPHKIVPNRTLV